MQRYLSVFLFLAAVLSSSSGHAFRENAFYAGLGYYSQNFMNKTAQKNDGATDFLGAPSYPLLVKMDFRFTESWFISPQFMYTIIPRSLAEDSGTSSTMHLGFPMGQNFGKVFDGDWDWFIGPGLTRYTIKGSGGTVVMNNGTGMQTFAKPGREVSVTKVTLNLGTSFTIGKSRFGLDLLFENPLSNLTRTQNLMFSYAYQFAGGGGF